MSITIYLVSAILVFFFFGLLAMAGLGAAFLFVPLFYYLGMPLAEATPTALLRTKSSARRPGSNLPRMPSKAVAAVGEELSQQEVHDFYDLRNEIQCHPLVQGHDQALSSLKSLFSQAGIELSNQLGVDFTDLAMLSFIEEEG